LLLIVNGCGDYFRNLEIRTRRIGIIVVAVSNSSFQLIFRWKSERTNWAHRWACEFLRLAHHRG